MAIANITAKMPPRNNQYRSLRWRANSPPLFGYFRRYLCRAYTDILLFRLKIQIGPLLFVNGVFTRIRRAESPLRCYQQAAQFPARQAPRRNATSTTGTGSALSISVSRSTSEPITRAGYPVAKETARQRAPRWRDGLRGWACETRTRKCRILWWHVLIEAAA
jgi:hypothetical protein